MPLSVLKKADVKPRVFGIGLHKTGTSSLCNGLEELGYRALHGSKKNSDLIEKAIFEGLDDPFRYVNERRWRQKKLPKGEQYDAFADLYALIDHFVYFEQVFPDALFVLTTRENDRWVQSIKRQIAVRRNTPYFHYWYYQNELQWLARKEMHEKTVREYFSDKPGKLLVMDITQGDGYDKLCPFLGLPRLEKAFPHENNTAEKAQALRG